MRLITGWERPAGTPTYGARAARAETPLPAVIVIHEVWGVDDHIRDLVDRFATAGYWAVAPDLYAEDGRRPEPVGEERIQTLKRFLDAAPPQVWRDPEARESALGELPAADAAALRETMSIVLTPDRPYARWLRTLTAVASAVRASPTCTGALVSTGYCLGGHLSALLAGADPDLSAAAIYYGASPPLEAMQRLACPLIGFYGGDDPRITGTVPAFEEALHAAGKRFEPHVYDGAPHAFFNDTRPSYRAGPARDAWARTLALFAQATSQATRG